MRDASEWEDDWASFPIPTIDVIRAIQKDAWNSALKAATKAIKHVEGDGSEPWLIRELKIK